jgi:acyl-CoA reductase-like NAD-dependent aldehyde dehydrogenase
VLAGVPDGVLASDEEIFGPVVCVRSVPDLETAFDQVNASRYGLYASVFTRSLAAAFRAVERLEGGGVSSTRCPASGRTRCPTAG